MQRVASLTDYRFEEAATSAQQAITKIQQMRERAETSATETLARAKAALDQGSHLEVVRLLQSIPQKLLSNEGEKILARMQAYTSEVTDLENRIRKGIANQDWVLVGGLIDQILVHSPDDPNYTRIAGQVSSKLTAAAKQLYSCGKYAAAVERLNSVPNSCRGDDFDSQRQTYEDSRWLFDQFESAPFVTPMLGRLAVRFARDVPHDEQAQQQVKKLAAELKQGKRVPRNPFPAGHASRQSWAGGKAEFLGLPQSIELGDQKLVKTCFGRFHVAIGLALQGLELARVNDHLGPKKSMLSAIGWRKQKLCWGIDIGTFALKAVCLQQEGDRVKVVDSYYQELSEPLCRVGVDADRQSEIVQEAVTKFLEDHELDDIPVWANLAASELVNRFVRLPPVADKQANAMLNLEVEQRIPIPADDLALVRWIGDLVNNDTRGRAACVSAAKKSVVNRRLEALEEAGLKVTGLQGDSIALANFVAYEFDSLLSPQDSEEEEEGDSDAEPADGGQDSIGKEEPPAIVVVECGASTTTFLVVTADSHWLWSIETGGDDLTSSIARATKSTHGEAEKLKRNPAALEMPSKQYGPAEQRMDEVRSRLEKVLVDAKAQNPGLNVVESWCLGGGSLAHQWICRLMLVK
ncbi:MAG: pilus assembly protein PilM [Pirellulales bacterium]|nr:pilus assembly protein PilM [Pirellulales bacterium]